MIFAHSVQLLHYPLQFYWLLGLLLFTGCAPIRHSRQISQKVSTEHKQGKTLLNTLRQPVKRQRVTIHQQPWVALKTLAPTVTRLPAALNQSIAFATGTPLPFSELSKTIHQLSRITLRLTPDAEDYLYRRQKQGLSPTQEPIVSGIRWQGDLEGLLDEISGSLGLSWRYQADPPHIMLYYLDSQTFQIYAIPSETTMSSTINSGIDVSLGTEGGGSQGSGQSAQKTELSLKSSMMADIQTTIRSLLTPQIGRASFSQSTGNVTVTDTPIVLKRIADYLAHENRIITQQVLLNIQVLSVELHDKSQLGINWNKCLYNLLNSQKSLVNSLGFTQQDNKLLGGHSTIFKITGGGKLNTAECVLEALSFQGKVSNITSPSVTTLNLQPVPVQIATQQSYLSRIEVTQKHGSKDTTMSLTPGMITHGFNMHLLPCIMPNQQLLLQFTINLSEKKGMKTFGASDNTTQIQLPEIDTRLFSQKVKLQSGDTLILSGFEQLDHQAHNKGVGHFKNWLMGDRTAHHRRSLIVLTITPVVLS